MAATFVLSVSLKCSAPAPQGDSLTVRRRSAGTEPGVEF